jgi:hypothetical protein
VRRRALAVCALAAAVAAALAIAGHAAAPPRGPACALDGVALGASFRVRVESGDGDAGEFCSVHCAEVWTAGRRAPRVLVRDETSGEDVDAAAATWVRSPVPTSRATAETLHAFRRRTDAAAHVAVHGGRILDDDERPFRGHPTEGSHLR